MHYAYLRALSCSHRLVVLHVPRTSIACGTVCIARIFYEHPTSCVYYTVVSRIGWTTAM